MPIRPLVDAEALTSGRIDLNYWAPVVWLSTLLPLMSWGPPTPSDSTVVASVEAASLDVHSVASGKALCEPVWLPDLTLAPESPSAVGVA